MSLTITTPGSPLANRTENRELAWLQRHLPKQDHLGVVPGRITPILEQIKRVAAEPHRLPFIYGLFGTWGSGKTAALALLAQALRDDAQLSTAPVLYFNAYKYAGTNDVMSALVYQILNHQPPPNDQIAKQRLLALLQYAGAKYADSLGKWTEEKIGVNLAEVVRDCRKLANVTTEPVKQLKAIMDVYYTRLDRTQDAVRDALRSIPLMVVLVDELDRCDPVEALDALKQLRILFCASGVPLVFVLAANPDPIGLAIKHMYGLDAGGPEYEARRILEKFVDDYAPVNTRHSLGDYISSIWPAEDPITQSALVLNLDARTNRAPNRAYPCDLLRFSTALESMTSGNAMFTNLRLLQKTLPYSSLGQDELYHPWFLWQLEILKQSNPQLRALVAKATDFLKRTTEDATCAVIDFVQPHLDQSGHLPSDLEFDQELYSTPFCRFRAAFWDSLRLQVVRGELAPDRSAIATQFLENAELMDFLTFLCLVNVVPPGTSPQFRKNFGSNGLAGRLTEWDPNAWANFGWLLATY